MLIKLHSALEMKAQMIRMRGLSLESESLEGQSPKAQSHGGPAERPDFKGGQSPAPSEIDFKSGVPDPVLKSLVIRLKRRMKGGESLRELRLSMDH